MTLVIGLLLAVTLPLAAQAATGRIVGRIVDAETGRGISDAGIQVVGTTMGIMSGFEGRYALGSIPAGTVTLQVRLLGYQPKTVTGLQLDAGATLEQDITLSAATVQLEMTVVTADAERGSVNAALDAQRNATGIVNSITSEQIQKSPDGDAAQAVQRVSGVTVQDGKYVYVRGLGERYTTASLNGARIPSPEPEKRLVPLDLFPSGLIQSVTTSKTFTPDQPGDFSGGSVEIQTREFPATREISYSASVGYNSAATGKSILAAPRVGSEWLGFAGAERDVPAILLGSRNVISFQRGDPMTNQIVNSLRNVWSVRAEDGTPNSSMSVSVGGSDPILGRTIGYAGAVTYSYNQEVRADELRELPEGVGDGGVQPYAAFRGSTGRASVQWGGLLNLSTLVGGATRVALNNTYSRTADNEARVMQGAIEEAEDRRSLLRYIERTVRSNQLQVQHQIGARHAIDWSVTSSGVTRREPDRAEVTYSRQLSDPAGTPFRLLTGRGARRSFLDLDESNINLGANYRLEFGPPGRTHFAKVGGAFRSTSRTSENLAYGISTTLPASALELPPEQIFDGRFAGSSDSIFFVGSEVRSGSYTADDQVAAGYAMLEFALGERLRLIGGARAESGDLEVITHLTSGQTVPSLVKNTDVLPSFALNFRPSESHNVRISASQTLSRPEYRELSRTNNEEVTTASSFEGNPNLRRTLIKNADARWEWYPSAGEVVSVGVFYKRFEDPIERVEVGVSGVREALQQTVVNAKGARNYGVELELRKGLGLLGPAFDGLVLFTNATLMESKIEIDDASQADAERAMVGQAPYVVNAGLTYSNTTGRVSTTALFNIVGERITAAVPSRPDVYEQPRHALDLSLRFPVFGSLSGKIDARNVFDEPYELLQDEVVRERYRAGRVFSLGLSWRQ
jgi:outer membrane receptor for ferrienterochelin and colicin